MTDTGKVEEYVLVAEARRQVYDLLSALYLELPNSKMIQSMFDTEFKLGLSSAVSNFEADEIKEGLTLIASFITAFKEQSTEEVLKRISIDRTRLLRGVSQQHSPPPPYESVYRDGRLYSESTIEVSQIYCRLGITLPQTWTEPPDYIGIELDFMRLICQGEKEAWQTDSFDKALEHLEVGGDFLKKHILQWVPRFCEEMYNKAELDFYKGIAHFTSGFVAYDSSLADQQIMAVKQKPTDGT